MQLEWTDESKRDLDRFIDFLIEKNPQAALNAIDAIERGAESLCEQPLKGTSEQGEYRNWSVTFGKYGYNLRYYPDFETNTIWIIRIWAGKEERKK